MTYYKLRTNYSPYTDLNLINLVKFAITCMTNNEHVEGIEPDLQRLDTLNKAYEDAYVAALKHTEGTSTIRNTARSAMAAQLVVVATFATSKCEGDLAKLKTCGLPIIEPKSQTSLDAPKIFEIKNTHVAGTIKVRINKPRGAKSYVFQFSETAPTVEEEHTFSEKMMEACRSEITGLPVTDKLYCRVKVFGPKGMISYTKIMIISTFGYL